MDQNYSPIEVILDVRQFQGDRIRERGGSPKEFFDGDDEGFKAHKLRVQQALRSAHRTLTSSSASSVGFVRVRMRDEALAKSHRPVRTLFNPGYAPVIGASDVGELIIQVSPLSLARALKESEKAEGTLDYKPSKKKPGELEPAPSWQRAEVGAIDTISLWSPADRRGFDIQDAIKWFQENPVSRAYRVDLFDPTAPATRRAGVEFAAAPDLTSDLQRALSQELKCGFVATTFRPDPQSMSRMYIWLFDNTSTRHIVPASRVGAVLQDLDQHPTLQLEAHRSLIAVLESHPLVRRISLPMQLRSETAAPSARTGASKSKHSFSLPSDGAQYPIVAIIDGGIDGIPAQWIRHSRDFLHPTHADRSHGTEIGSLLIDGQGLNGPALCPEPDGCWIADLSIIPVGDEFDSYYGSEIDLITQIELEVQEAKAAVGARVFSFSHNFREPPGGNPVYTELSSGLDRVARENDVVFVVSAGNVPPSVARPRREWTSDNISVLSNLASCSDDRITAPADSVLNIAVGAINPPNVPGALADAPARYSRRGPGFMQLVKPDVAHYGGVCDTTAANSGLTSVTDGGILKSVFGTSYSAPLVAKALARYDLLTQGALPREALVALLIHGAKAPACLSTYDRAEIVRNFVGFGVPTATDAMVNGSPHSATLLFYDRMMESKDLFFGFDWPQSLATDGKCRGTAMLTLIYAPPISDAFQTELVRVNLDAALQQRHPKTGKFQTKCTDTFSHSSKNMGVREKELIEDGLKWGVVKQSQYFSEKGKGASSDWRIAMKYLLRSNEKFPTEGIPFAMMLTISDPDSSAPVYQDMKIALTTRQVLTSDIRQPSGRIQARGGRAAG